MDIAWAVLGIWGLRLPGKKSCERGGEEGGGRSRCEDMGVGTTETRFGQMGYGSYRGKLSMVGARSTFSRVEQTLAHYRDGG